MTEGLNINLNTTDIKIIATVEVAIPLSVQGSFF